MSGDELTKQGWPNRHDIDFVYSEYPDSQIPGLRVLTRQSWHLINWLCFNIKLKHACKDKDQRYSSCRKTMNCTYYIKNTMSSVNCQGKDCPNRHDISWIHQKYLRNTMGKSGFIVAKWSQIAKFMGPTWGPPGSCWPQMGPMLAPWTLL